MGLGKRIVQTDGRIHDYSYSLLSALSLETLDLILVVEGMMDTGKFLVGVL